MSFGTRGAWRALRTSKLDGTTKDSLKIPDSKPGGFRGAEAQNEGKSGEGKDEDTRIT